MFGNIMYSKKVKGSWSKWENDVIGGHLLRTQFWIRGTGRDRTTGDTGGRIVDRVKFMSC